MEKIDISKLSPVENTALLMLVGRALDSKSEKPFIKDKKAESILDMIDFDIKNLGKLITKKEIRRFSMRAVMYDSLVKPFINDYPNGTVIEVGCGLNTRFDRLDNGSIHWFDIDLPEMMKVRENFFINSERYQNIGYSILENDWIPLVKESGNPPYMFVSEGVLPYFKEEELKSLFKKIADNFKPSQYLFESMTDFGLKTFKKKSNISKHIQADLYTINDVKVFEQWDTRFKIMRSLNTFESIPKVVYDKLPLLLKLIIPPLNKLFKKKIDSMKINIVKLS